MITVFKLKGKAHVLFRNAVFTAGSDDEVSDYIQFQILTSDTHKLFTAIYSTVIFIPF